MSTRYGIFGQEADGAVVIITDKNGAPIAYPTEQQAMNVVSLLRAALGDSRLRVLPVEDDVLRAITEYGKDAP